MDFEERFISCGLEMLDAHALPETDLVRVDDDMTFAADFRKRFADVQRRNAIRTADFNADPRLDLRDDLLKKRSFVRENVGVERKHFSRGRLDLLGLKDVFEDRIHRQRSSQSQASLTVADRHEPLQRRVSKAGAEYGSVVVRKNSISTGFRPEFAEPRTDS